MLCSKVKESSVYLLTRESACGKSFFIYELEVFKCLNWAVTYTIYSFFFFTGVNQCMLRVVNMAPVL